MAKTSADAIVPTMEGWFKQLPKLPVSIVDFLVMVAPWLALIFGVMGVLAALAALGLWSTYVPYNMMPGARTGMWQIQLIAVLISSVLTVLAFPGLRVKKMQGWMMLFWSQIVSTIAAIIGISIGGIIGAIICFYILFQIKARYN